MAQVYPYFYKGKLRTKQDKCRAMIPLDRARIWLDFNEYCAEDENTRDPIYLFSQADIVSDSEGNDIELCEGMEVFVFDYDLNSLNEPDALLAQGILIKNFLEYYPNTEWLIRLTKNKEEYIYRMSDL